MDIENVFVCNQISSGEKKKTNYKSIIGYLYDDYKVKPFHILLMNTSTYVKSYDGQTKWMYFLIEDNDLLGKYNTIWVKVRADIKKEFYSEHVYSKNIWRTKIKSYGDEATDS